jgi:hypothetical protein
MRQITPRAIAAALVCALAGTLLSAPAMPASRALPAETRGWATYEAPGYGFSLSLPDGLLIRDKTRRQPNGGSIWMTRDRTARLIATAGPNPAKQSVEAYRAAILKESYRGARLDYAPVRANSFVLSGIISGPKGDRIFYERIAFVCDGRYIYGWQMMYPVSERQKYDRIVEAVHKSYQAGKGRKGDCSP